MSDAKVMAEAMFDSASAWIAASMISGQQPLGLSTPPKAKTKSLLRKERLARRVLKNAGAPGGGDKGKSEGRKSDGKGKSQEKGGHPRKDRGGRFVMTREGKQIGFKAQTSECSIVSEMMSKVARGVSMMQKRSRRKKLRLEQETHA